MFLTDSFFTGYPAQDLNIRQLRLELTDFIKTCSVDIPKGVIGKQLAIRKYAQFLLQDLCPLWPYAL
jgi:hypothetical protein